jgi:two-component system, response regulator PdtaR
VTALTTILVVEDEAIVRKDLVNKLEAMHYNPVCAVSTGDEAVQKARECAPDIILMDIHISGAMDGLEAAGLIRDELDIPVIFVTSFADDAVIERAKRVNPYGYVLKPFTALDLKVAIEIALSRKAAETLSKNGDLPLIPQGTGEKPDERKDYAGLPDIRALLLEDFFSDTVLFLYNNTEVKEQAFTTFIEKSLESRGSLLFAYSFSRAHRKFQKEIRLGILQTCRMKAGDAYPLKKILSEYREQPAHADPVPFRFILDFSERFDPEDILSCVEQVLAIRYNKVPISGIVALSVGTNDDDLIKALSQSIPRVIVTTSRGSVISCADHTYTLEHLSYLPQPVVDEMVKKVLEPVILAFLDRPVSGNDILRGISERYNVSVPKARIYTHLYELENKGYLSMSVSGKSKVYTPTESGRQYIRQKLREFNSVSHHILSEIINRNAGTKSHDTGK